MSTRNCRHCHAVFHNMENFHDTRNCPTKQRCRNVHSDGRVCVLAVGHDRYGSYCASVIDDMLVPWGGVDTKPRPIPAFIREAIARQTTPITGSAVAAVNQMQCDIAALRAIRARIDTAIIDQQRVTFDARSNEVREAVKIMVAHLRFYGGTHRDKTPVMIERVISIIAPEVYAVLENEGVGEAHRIVDPSLTDSEDVA